MSEAPASVASPCVSICVLDEHDICLGCFRSSREITDWMLLGDERKRVILQACRQRREASGLLL